MCGTQNPCMILWKFGRSHDLDDIIKHVAFLCHQFKALRSRALHLQFGIHWRITFPMLVQFCRKTRDVIPRMSVILQYYIKIRKYLNPVH